MIKSFYLIVLITAFTLSNPAFSQTKGRSGTLPTPSQASVNRANVGKNSASTKNTQNTTKSDHVPKTISSQLSHNPALMSKLQLLLPNTDLVAASDGFTNLGQFVAAVHVSENHEIPFDLLRDKMVTQKLSLGESIQEIKDELTTEEANAAVKEAEAQAKEDIAKSKSKSKQ